MVGYRTIDKVAILFEGKSVQDSLEHIHRSVSYSTQAPLPLGFMKVYDILLTTARLRGKDKRAAIDQADLWLNRLGISAIKTSRLQNVSGGQRRLVGFATALMGDFTTLILDEPTNELDPEKRKLLWSSLVTLKKELGITIIVVTHDVDESEEFIDNAILFSHGQLVAQGPPAYFSEISNNNNYKIAFTIDGDNIEEFSKELSTVSRLEVKQDKEDHLFIHVPQEQILIPRDSQGLELVERGA